MLTMNSLHILCFGDSLTAGWTRLGAVYHPYDGSMLESLEKSFPSLEFTTDVQGSPGDQVVSPPGGFLPRIDILYEETETLYDWAIILGGTNDLSVGRGASDIWKGLKKVYDFPLSNNTKVLALTVPDCGSCADSLDARRDKLNKLILNHTAKNFYTFDIHSAFPYWNLTDERRKELWSDGTHPTEEGYNVIGSLLGDRLKELISGSNGITLAQEPLKSGLNGGQVKAEKKERVVGNRFLRSRRAVA